MARPDDRLRSPRGLRAALLAAALLIMATNPALVRHAGGQEPEGALGPEDTETMPVNVSVRVVNGTTREPGRAEVVSLQEIGPLTQTIATARDVTGEAVLSHLFLDETRSYLVQATSNGIAYFTRTTGHELAAGPATVYVFATTTDRAGVSVSELNLTLKRTENDLQLEYMITILNEASPQRTVLPNPTSFELLLPERAVGAAVEVLTGAAPQHVAPLAGVKPARAGLAVPLRSGVTRLRVTTSLPYDGRAQLVLESSLPVSQITLFAFPPDLRVDGDFDDEGVMEDTGYRRLAGSSLAADTELRWSVSGGSPPRIATGSGEAKGRTAESGRLAKVKRTGASFVGWLVVFVALAMVALALVYRAHRANAAAARLEAEKLSRRRSRRRA